MHRPETREDAVLEAGNHLNDALLFGNLHLGLEADDVEKFVREIFFAELYDCIWPVAGCRFFEPHRLHRTETERVGAARGHLFDRQTSFEMRGFLEIVQRIKLGGQQRADERFVVFAMHRCVEVIRSGSLPVSRFPVELRQIERVGGQNRSDGVVKIESVASQEIVDGFKERV